MKSKLDQHLDHMKRKSERAKSEFQRLYMINTGYSKVFQSFYNSPYSISE